MRTERPVGFSPAEVSGLINHDVVLQHADEAAFLWTQRNRAIGEPHFSLKDLAALDGRVEAHVDGLRIAGEVAWKICEGAAATGESGAVFAASTLAFGSRARNWTREALRAADTSMLARAALVAALGWLEYETVQPWIELLIGARSPAHRTLAIRAYAVHRHDPGALLTAAIHEDDSPLRQCALRTAGELKRHDLRDAVRSQMQDADEGCRFWAAWSSVLLGVREGLPLLVDIAERDEMRRVRAMQLALRAMSLEEARRWIRSLAQRPERERMAVVAAGIVGDPTAIPWLITKIKSANLAKLAGEAFSMITGVDLAFDDLEISPPTPPDNEDAIEAGLTLDYESNLRVPSYELVSAWWDKHRRSFSSGTRYLAGRPVDQQGGTLDVLANGRQRQRAAAALELALLYPERPLFEVRAPAWRQQQQLTVWTL